MSYEEYGDPMQNLIDDATRERDEALRALADLTQLVARSLVLSVTPELVAAKALLIRQSDALSMREKADQ